MGVAVRSEPRFIRHSGRPARSDGASAGGGARVADLPAAGAAAGEGFWRSKRAFDVAFALALLPVLAVLILIVAPANAWRNPGPLLFRQRRMGRHGAPFVLWKLRTMRPSGDGARGPEDPLERERISRFGELLRRSRLDEMPQIINVLRGEMSFVGPRPDVHEHALVFCETVPGYRERHRARPGITGLAQVRLGYVEGTRRTIRKVTLDLAYLQRASWRLEVAILARTVVVMLSGAGAK